MTLSGPSIPTAMAEANDTRLLSIDGLDLHLLAGQDFDSVADSVGLLREATYRQQLSGSGDERDLDGRDAHYDHLLLVERSSGELAGAARSVQPAQHDGIGLAHLGGCGAAGGRGDGPGGSLQD